MILVCGRYEGVDERVVEHLATAEISIGDFIVSGGEIAAAVVVDAVIAICSGSGRQRRVDFAGLLFRPGGGNTVGRASALHAAR